MSTWLSQTDRFLQLTTSLQPEELILTTLSGQESLSKIFQFNLQMLSNNTNITPDKLLGTPVSIQLNSQQSNQPRYFHGHVFNFQAGHISEGIRFYQADIRPWLWFLNHSSDCHIFQNKNIIDIIKLIFSEYSFSNYDISKLTKTYIKREYCVQYRETTLNFINRILAEEGIFYFFRHEENKHTMVLADKTSVLLSCADNNINYTAGSNSNYGLTQWKRRYAFYSGNFAQTDFNFENPDVCLLSKQSNNAKLAASKKYEIFHYPGKHENPTQGKSLAQQHFETSEMQYDVIDGEGNYASFTSGSKFSLADCPNAADEGDYILTAVTHYASDNSYLQTAQGGHIYHNLFTCIPINTPFRPPHTAAKPLIIGAQTAIVVGPPGEELYTDKYGRVCVQFHWDRKGNKDENSSCWIRVAQLWAGKNWGTLFMPRIGQEVVVHFLDGDPDRPLIIGSVYNNDNLPPYSLPFSQTQSGFTSNSTKGGGPNNANILRFDDKNGSEEFFIQAEKDFNQTIKNNLSIQVGNQSTLQAQQSIELKVGNSSLLINTAGIFLNGEKVNINS